MSFRNSITYEKLYKRYGDKLCYILSPWNKHVQTDRISTGSTSLLFMYGASTGFETPLHQIGGLNSESTLGIVSTSALDINGSAGASEIFIQGSSIGNSYRVSEYILMQGTSTVTTGIKYNGIISMEVTKMGDSAIPSGSGATSLGAAGTIKAIGGSGASGDIHATIAPGDSKANLGYYFVPKNKRLYITNIKVTVQGEGRVDPSVSWELFGSTFIDQSNIVAPIKVFSGRADTDDPSEHNFTEPLVFEQGSLVNFLIRRVDGTAIASLFVEGYELVEEGHEYFSRAYNRDYKYEPSKKNIYEKYANSIKYTEKGAKYRRKIRGEAKPQFRKRRPNIPNE